MVLTSYGDINRIFSKWISLTMGHTLMFIFVVSIHTTCTESSVKPRDSNYDADRGIVGIGVMLEYQSSI